jgi:hypothetical protein
MKITTTTAVKEFKCLQADCPDTCCKGWSMQLDDLSFEKYKKNGLEDAVAYDGEIRVMKRNPATDYCVKFEGGICGIHKDFGAEMLGDACNLYPRITRQLGAESVMTMTPSCPEALRLMLENNEPVQIEPQRLPQNLKNWLDPEISNENAHKIQQRFLDETKAEASSAAVMGRIYSVCRSMGYINKAEWADAINFMFKTADGKLPPAQKSEMNNLNIFQVFIGILHATGKKPNERLMAVINAMSAKLGIEVDFQTLLLIPVANPNLAESSPIIEAILKKYLAAQISFSSFPFAGIGADPLEKAKILIFKYCLARLALLSFDGSEIDAIQPLSRIVDHLGNAELTLTLMNNFWSKEANLVGLILG